MRLNPARAFFLPAIFELKQPRDAGPRRIINMSQNDLAGSKARFDLSLFVDLDDVEKGESMKRRRYKK